MILNDIEINRLAHKGMIEPYRSELIRKVEVTGNKMSQELKVISYGQSSFGYDIRLSDKEFKTFQHIPGTIVNPKEFNNGNLRNVGLNSDKYGVYFILPAHSYGLGVAVEKIAMPIDTTAIAISKSTYARCGIICNISPLEAGWSGYLTIEVSNSSSADCRIYANEGIAQLLFLRGQPCNVSYATRNGKYQNQPQQIVTSKI